MSRVAIALACSLFLLLAACSQSSLPTDQLRTLATFDLSGSCEAQALYDAIATANTNGEADTIILDGGCTYKLTGPQLEVTSGSEITVQGNGATIESLGKSNIFVVRVFYNNGTLTLEQVTVTGAVVNDNAGGGIWNNGTLTLNNSTVSGNSADFLGGGIVNGGTLTLNNSTVSGNSSFDVGGGIFNDGTLILNNSTVSGNSAIVGGGIYHAGSSLILKNSTVSGNTAGFYEGGSADGGGIFNDGPLTLENSTVDGNTADSGGGIYNYRGTLTLINSTVSGNEAPVFGGGIYNRDTLTLTNSTVSNNLTTFGGGIYTDVNGTTTLENSTLSENTANGGGGGVDVYGTLILSHSVIANSSGGDCRETAGSTITDLGSNLIEDGSCLSDASSLSGDPMLGPLADNGGPTLTYLPLAGSPLIDASTCVNATDQRGVTRPQGAACDIGAVEVEVVNQAPTAGAGGPYSGNEGQPITLDSSASSDPDGDTLSYSWSVDSSLCSFVDATLAMPTLTCADDGSFTVGLVVNDGTVDSAEATTTVTVANLDPVIDSFRPDTSTIIVGQSVTATGSFSDVPADTPLGNIDWGDGDTTPGLASGFSESHVYSTPGSYAVQLSVEDEDGGSSSTSVILTVLSPGQTIDQLIRMVKDLRLSKNTEKSFLSLLEQAKKSYSRGDTAGTLHKLMSFINMVQAQSGKKIAAADADKLIAYTELIISAVEQGY